MTYWTNSTTSFTARSLSANELTGCAGEWTAARPATCSRSAGGPIPRQPKAVRHNGRVEPQVEELPDNRVRLTVDVPRAQVEHAVEHAASDLAETVKIPGFRQGKVPMPVLLARVGRERLHSEAVESHIGGWFMNAAARSRIRPVEQPEYDYELPETPERGLAVHGDGLGAAEARARRLDAARGAGAGGRGPRGARRARAERAPQLGR